jgi:hypothetical protein
MWKVLRIEGFSDEILTSQTKLMICWISCRSRTETSWFKGLWRLPFDIAEQSALDRWTVWQHTEWDDTRYCKYTSVLLKMSTAMLETCWGSWCNIIIEYIKLCIKLMINSSLHYDARSENHYIGKYCRWKYTVGTRIFKPLRKKMYLSDLKTQSVQRSKHSLLRL